MVEGANRIFYGTICLICCCIFYLIWWSVTFNPEQTYPAVPKYILFAFTFAAGLSGVVLLLAALRGMPQDRGTVSNIVIVILGIVCYFALLLISARFLHRQVTTELFLITAWTVLELCIINSLYRAGGPGAGTAIIYAVITLAAAVISMVCYLLYYDLDPKPAFYTGMVPLILFAAAMAAQLPMIKGFI